VLDVAVERLKPVDTDEPDGSTVRSSDQPLPPVVCPGTALEEPALTAFSELMEKTAVVEIDLPNGCVRRIRGIISHVTACSTTDPQFACFQLEMVPAVWKLSIAQRSRIFQQMSVPEIITTVLADLPHRLLLDASDFTFPKRECVSQRNESDWRFVSRLMEEGGLYCYFEHGREHEILVISNNRSYRGVDSVGLGSSAVRFREVDAAEGCDHIRTWQISQQITCTGVNVTSYHPQLAHTRSVWSESADSELRSGSIGHAVGGKDRRLESQLYIGVGQPEVDSIDQMGAKRPDRLNLWSENVQRSAVLELRPAMATAVTVLASGDSLRQIPGFKIMLRDHPFADGEYFVTSEELTYHLGDNYRCGNEGDFSESIFQCIPASVRFAPPRMISKPAVAGLQTGVVTGPAGEEIFTDEYGRVKVQFHWDATAASGGLTSCWIPVSTVSAGAKYGTQHIPRVGEEVLIACIDGDIDKPCVVGCVRNSTTLPPSTLPAEKAVVMRTIPHYPNTGQPAHVQRLDASASGVENYRYDAGDVKTFTKGDVVETTEGTVHGTYARRADQTFGDSHSIVDGTRYEKLGAQFVTVEGIRGEQIQRSCHSRIGGDKVMVVGGDHIERVDGDFVLGARGLVIQADDFFSVSVGGSTFTITEAGIYFSAPEVAQGGSPRAGRQAQIGRIPLPMSPLQASLPDPNGYAQTIAASRAVTDFWACSVHAPDRGIDEGLDGNFSSSWIEIELKDKNIGPLAGESYEVELPDGTLVRGVLDEKGGARIVNIPTGTCKVRFPEYDRDTWQVVQASS